MVGPSRVTMQETISADVLYDLGQDGMKMRRVGDPENLYTSPMSHALIGRDKLYFQCGSKVELRSTKRLWTQRNVFIAT